MSSPNSLFVRASKAQPTERTPVWFMRQAGRYMPEYRAIRKQYSLIEICKKPEVAAQVTIEAAEILKVDAAIIFADLLLPLEVMGLPFHFAAGEGPKIEKPIRTAEDVTRLRTDRAADLGYVSEAVKLVCKHFGNELPVIGFCGAPFTLASYMIEGGGSRNYLFTKKMMYFAPAAWNELMQKLVSVKRLQKTGVPVIYFGTDSSTLLPSMQETGAEVIGLDWRIPLDTGWKSLGFKGAVQGNLDPVLLFADWKELRSRAEKILELAAGRPGHIFNLGHGILPETPVENVKALCDFVRDHSADFKSAVESKR
jgi:uroporphyrinogen decarboxylase